MKYELKKHKCDLVIVGAGLAGICAALQAARQGVSVALINDRGVLGGNASAEIGVFINGANDGGQLNLNAREGGIVSEILLDYKYRSPARTNALHIDSVYLDLVYKEENITMFLNTCIDEAVMEDGKIISVSGTQNTTETRWEFSGKWFVDNTGDGALGGMVGADYMIGREAKSTFNESIAEDVADKYVLPSTLSFNTHNVGYKVPYVGPDFAYDIPATGILDRRDVKGFSTKWYFEIGGEYDHVKDRETIIKEHKKLILGIWHYLKNSGEFPECDNYDFDSISTIPGTREYRRLVGDYILTENDIREQKDFEDTIGHGGWNIDLHAIKGIFDNDLVNRHINFDGIYQIPYRVAYSKNIANMFMCGRCMSTSHVAFGSTRVMATLSTVGQAVGMASAICKKYNIMPRDVYTNHMKELQQALLREDQLIVGNKNEDYNDKAREATIKASTVQKYELAQKNPIDFGKRLEAMTPQFRSTYEKMYSRLGEGIPLNNRTGIILPINKRLDTLQLLVSCKVTSELSYDIYLPRKKENYGPDQLVKSNVIRIEGSNEDQWVDLDVDIEVDGQYLLIVLNTNEDISLVIGGDSLPTTATLVSYKNENPTNVHISNLKMQEYDWNRLYISPCFKTIPEQVVYGPENVNNGYNRAYGLPNMWLSEKGDNHDLSLEWNHPIDLSELQITFAIDTTKRFYSECDTQYFDLIGVDYDVVARVNGKELVLAEIRNNHKKLNRIHFDKISTNKVSFRFLSTSSNQVGVYEVRAYGPLEDTI